MTTPKGHHGPPHPDHVRKRTLLPSQVSSFLASPLRSPICIPLSPSRYPTLQLFLLPPVFFHQDRVCLHLGHSFPRFYRSYAVPPLPPSLSFHGNKNLISSPLPFMCDADAATSDGYDTSEPTTPHSHVSQEASMHPRVPLGLIAPDSKHIPRPQLTSPALPPSHFPSLACLCPATTQLFPFIRPLPTAFARLPPQTTASSSLAVVLSLLHPYRE